MPIRNTKDTSLSSARTSESPFVGPIDHTVGVLVDLTAFTTGEIDANGYTKAGIPLRKTGAKVTATNFVFGVTVEPVKVAKDGDSATIAALGTVELAVATICQVNQDIAEDLLGRAYTAAEIAGFDLAGSKCVLL
jgi:hypothetical protein